MSNDMSHEEFKALINSLVESSKQIIQNGENIEDVLKYLHTQSNSKLVSMGVISKLLNISLGDAKMLVHTSKVWGHVKERDEKIHEEILSAFEQMQKENKA